MRKSSSRCFWCAGVPEFEPYHDTEWGFPVDDDVRLFEKLTLEGFQSGLSWRTILNKRENFRKAFRGFDIDKIARFGPRDVERLLKDAGIVRHRGKIESTINNARRAREMRKEFGTIAAYVWQYEATDRPERMTEAVVRTFTKSPESIAMSKDLKKRGWSYVGPTTMYAFMQAMGLVNDHTEDCFVRERALRARARFRVPG
ncbi:MAG: DNA-3-methyladenine glycosylase I [Planctomycetota bacterium]